MNELEILCYIAAPTVLIVFGIILILAAQIFKPEEVDFVLPAEPRHLAIVDEDDDTIIVSHTVVGSLVFEDIQDYPQMGRRGIESVVRQQRVADDWCPLIGNHRIHWLEEQTRELVFVPAGWTLATHGGAGID